MWQNAHDTYLEERVLSADPIELVRLLYQATIAAVRKARGHLAAGEIAERSRAISHAYRLLTELSTSLDHQRGGDVSRRLAQMYSYIMRRLIEANVQQKDEPLAEILGLLTTLAEGWEGVQPATQAQMPQSNPWAQPAQNGASAYSSHAWNF
jgi:flagellar secretion chaperone FliS